MWVRSSTASYCSFNLDMDRSPGFGSTLTDSFALLRLGFPSAPDFLSLTSPVRVTRRTVLQKVRGSPCGVPQLVNTGFQVLFHSPPGVLFTFPSQYYALSVTVSRCTLDPAMSLPSSRTGLSPSLAGFPKTILLTVMNHVCSPNPTVHAPWFGLFPFRSPLLRESMFLSLPPAT